MLTKLLFNNFEMEIIIKQPLRKIQANKWQGHAAIFLCAAIFGLGVSVAQNVAAKRSAFRSVNINNTQPRRDINGEIIDAHDGCLQFFNGRYYLYGTAYGKTHGYSFNNRFRVYS